MSAKVQTPIEGLKYFMQAYRAHGDLTIKDAAKKCGITPSTFGRIEQGEETSVAQLRQLATGMNVTIIISPEVATNSVPTEQEPKEAEASQD